MQTVYSEKNSSTQCATENSAASVFDNSSQGKSLQRKADLTNNAAQRAAIPRPNNTGMPDNLKTGIESLSGFSMDDVRVHYNSSKPATVQALAYTQGTDIHVAPGQEKCLPHEAWHVAQQMAGRVSPTTNINGMPVNDNTALEHEADVMGAKAVTQRMEEKSNSFEKKSLNDRIVQKMDVLKSTPAFRKHHLLTARKTSFSGLYTPEDILIYRYNHEKNFTGINSMITCAVFKSMPDADPDEERVVTANVWHVRVGPGVVEAIDDGEQNARLCFDKNGDACHMDEKVGAVRK